MMTLCEVVNKKIHDMFAELAEEIGSGRLSIELTEDEWSSVPFLLFSAEMTLTQAWERYVTNGEV